MCSAQHASIILFGGGQFRGFRLDDCLVESIDVRRSVMPSVHMRDVRLMSVKILDLTTRTCRWDGVEL